MELCHGVWIAAQEKLWELLITLAKQESAVPFSRSCIPGLSLYTRPQDPKLLWQSGTYKKAAGAQPSCPHTKQQEEDTLNMLGIERFCN